MLDVIVALFVGALLGYASARLTDAMGARAQRRAAERLARAEVRRLRLALGAGNAGVGELLAAAAGLPVRLHSAVERLLRRDAGVFGDGALVVLLRLEDALRGLEAEVERVWQESLAEAASEALVGDVARAGGASVTRLGGDVAARLEPAQERGRAAAARCLRATAEVRSLLDELERATAPAPGWRTRVRLALRGARSPAAAPGELDAFGYGDVAARLGGRAAL